MSANKLVINSDKTPLLVMGIKASNKRRGEVTLEAGPCYWAQKTESFLGNHICEDLKWKEHVLGSDQSLVRQLTSRVNGLLKVAARATFSTRLSVANVIFMSKLCYLIQPWGGAEGYLLNSLQILQNRAARAVTRMFWFTPTMHLSKECNWLSVKQLVFYHRVLMTFKIVQNKTPMYLYQKMNTTHPCMTRQANGGGIRFR